MIDGRTRTTRHYLNALNYYYLSTMRYFNFLIVLTIQNNFVDRNCGRLISGLGVFPRQLQYISAAGKLSPTVVQAEVVEVPSRVHYCDDNRYYHYLFYLQSQLNALMRPRMHQLIHTPRWLRKFDRKKFGKIMRIQISCHAVRYPVHQRRLLKTVIRVTPLVLKYKYVRLLLSIATGYWGPVLKKLFK